MIIHLQPKKEKLFKVRKVTNLEKITNILFSNKRKMINKNIKKILSKKKIESIDGLNLYLRPANLKPEIYYKITELFEKKQIIFFLQLWTLSDENKHPNFC